MLTGNKKIFKTWGASFKRLFFQIGKDGYMKSNYWNWWSLESRELIKVKILESCQQDKNEIAQELSLKTDAEVVQILGRTIILYRESEKGNLSFTMKIGIFWRLFWSYSFRSYKNH